mmetsp:Transcript_74015/g.216846  ORF Transcript_74015/g.216846 Transcript_74015/m.216846 type:complete len:259 (+) Transcript_74015:82-858(+)
MGKNARANAPKTKKKYRRQDPNYKGPVDIDSVHNKAPLGDVDCIDIPTLTSALTPMIPGGVDPEERNYGTVETAIEKAKNRHAKRKADRKSGKEARPPPKRPADEADKGQDAAPETGGALPKRRRGESERDYSDRCDQVLKQRLLDTRRKMGTENARDKRRRRAEAKREKLLAKSSSKKTDDLDGLFGKTEKYQFGDIVKRPPILSADSMKSRSKLKSSPLAAPGGKKANDLSDYAAKVKEAYAELRNKRQKAAGLIP